MDNSQENIFSPAQEKQKNLNGELVKNLPKKTQGPEGITIKLY